MCHTPILRVSTADKAKTVKQSTWCLTRVKRSVPSAWHLVSSGRWQKPRITFPPGTTDWHLPGKPAIYRWLSSRLQHLQCVSNGDTTVLHWAIGTVLAYGHVHASPEFKFWTNMLTTTHQMKYISMHIKCLLASSFWWCLPYQWSVYLFILWHHIAT